MWHSLRYLNKSASIHGSHEGNEDLLEPPTIVWAWAAIAPGFTKGSIRPDWTTEQPIRQNASALPEKQSASAVEKPMLDLILEKLDVDAAMKTRPTI